MLLALFLLELSTGLYLFLPLVGRRNAGTKFYRLILLICVGLTGAAALALWLADSLELLAGCTGILLLSAIYWLVLRYPKRLIFKATALFLGVLSLATSVAAFHLGTRSIHLAWSVAGAISSIAILGSVNMAMLLGHWYLVVRGMSIDPLKRLTMATLASTLVRILVVAAVLVALGRHGFEVGSPGYRVTVSQGIFFWMRVGWGLLAPLALYPMIWSTVKIRSTMAATGILYVAVVAVVIGEILGVYLASLEHLPL